MVRTEETLDNIITSYASVIDLEGKILMKECIIAKVGLTEQLTIVFVSNHSD